MTERILWSRWIVKLGKGNHETTIASYETREAAQELADVLNKNRALAVSPGEWMGEYWVKESVVRIRESVQEPKP